MKNYIVVTTVYLQHYWYLRYYLFFYGFLKSFKWETSGKIKKGCLGKILHNTSNTETAIFQINFLTKLKKVV